MSDQDMIERVAKAIALRDTGDEYAMARAAIKAMREPTEKMLDHIQGALDCVPIDRCKQQALQVWKAGIGYILND